MKRRPTHSRSPRRGFALLDALIGGVLLGLGLAVLLSISSRASALQVDGQRRLQATWLADEILSMVVVEGPDKYQREYETNGRFEEPFNNFYFDVEFEDDGQEFPVHVIATITWNVNSRVNRSISVEADIARRPNEDEDNSKREPVEPFDRQARWDEILDPYQ